MSTQNTVSLSLPDKVSGSLGQSVNIKVTITDFSGQDREVLVRLVGSLTGPLPAVTHKLVAHLSLQVELPMMVPAGMPPGDHPVLIEVLDRSNGVVLGSGEVFLEVQRTRSVAMHLSPPSIRRRLSGKIRLVLRNHDDQTHFIRLRTEPDDQHSKISLHHHEVELRAGEMVRIKGRLKVRPFFIGKQREHWYSIIGEGSGAPIYGRGNVRHIPMIGRNVKSIMGLMCILLVWASATLVVLNRINPVTQDSTASAADPNEQIDKPDEDSNSSGNLELPTLVDVSGTVTAVPDGSGVIVKWRSVTIGDVEGTGKVAPTSSTSNPNIANLSTATDEKGQFSVAGLDASGLYEFTFSKEGQKTKKIIVQPNGEPVILEVALEVGDGLISGTTVDEFGDPLGGSNVTLTDGNITYQTTTPTEGESIGKFTFEYLSTPATWVIDAKSNGRGIASSIINLNAGDQQKDVVLSLSPDVTTLGGTVTTTFFADSSVVTITATDGVITRTTSTLTREKVEGSSDLVGKFLLTDLPIGRTFTITYVADGYQTLTEQVELTTQSTQRLVELRRSTGSLGGKISGDNLDATRVAISITNNDNSYKSTDLVRDDGSYLYSNIVPGTYVVTYIAMGFEPFITEANIAPDINNLIQVELIEIQYSPTNYLNFEVLNADGAQQSPQNWTVKIRYRSTGDCGEIPTDSNLKVIGVCEFQIEDGTKSSIIAGLNPGAYYLEFQAENFANQVVLTDSKEPASDGKQEELTKVSLTEKGTLTGQVTDGIGAPVQGLRVILKSSTGAVIAEGRTNADGEYKGADGTQIFDQKLENATYSLEIGSDTYTAVTRTVVGSEATTINVDLKVNAVSLIAGEVRSLNVSSGNYDATDPNMFFIYYRQHSDTSETDWLKPEENMGISKSLGTYRLSINPYATPNDTNSTPYDVCIVVKKEQAANTPEGNCSSSTDLTTKVFEKIVLSRGGVSVNSTYSTPNPGSLSGSVTVEGTRTQGVLVQARREDSTGKTVEVFAQTTNIQGDFSFTSLTPTGINAPAVLDDPTCDIQLSSCWIISIADPLYEGSESTPVSVYPNKETKVTQALAAEFKTGEVLIYLRESSGPASGVQVVEVLESGNTTNLCTAALGQTKQSTGANGVCLIKDVRSGFHTYQASKTGMNTSTISLTVIGGQDNFASGFLTANTGELLVTLQDSKGTLVSGVSISATDSQGNTKSCITRTSDEKQSNLGSCVIEELSFGTVSVNSAETTAPASVSGLASASGTTSIGSGGAALTLTAVSRYGTLNLSFVDSSSNPVLGANASVSSLSCLAPDDKNSCEIENVPEGSQTISYQKEGFLDSNLQITVIRGTNTTIRITLYKVTSTLTGTVYDNQNCVPPTTSGCTKVQNAIVSANTASGLSAFTVTDGNGVYNFETLSPGQWFLQTVATGYAKATPVEITVSSTSVGSQNLFITPLDGSIELAVLSPIGAPISGIKVTVTPADNTDPSETDGNGQVAFTKRPAGTYSVSISDSFVPARYASQQFDVKVDRASTTRFNVYLGTYGSFISIPVVGIPASAFGPPTPLSVDVALMNASGNVVYTSPTQNVGAQKVASFAGVSDGTYTILIVNSFTPIAISAITTGNQSTSYRTIVDHQLTDGDSVTISGVGQTNLNASIASITRISDTEFSIDKNSSGLTVPGNLSGAIVTKLDKNNWNANSRSITVTEGGTSKTYTVPAVPNDSSITVSNVNTRTMVLDPITLRIKTGQVAVTVMSGDAIPVLVNQAQVILSEGFLLNPLTEATNNGVATFTDIPPGDYSITINTSGGFNSLQKITVPDFGTTSTYSTTTSLTSGSGSIDFNVMAGTSGGLSGATVTDNTSGKTCVTAGPGETLGKCTISDLSSGSHTFRVIRDGYDLLDVTANIQSGRTVSQAVSLSTGTGDVHLTAINAQNGTTALSGVTFSTSGKTDCITNPCTFSALPLSLKNFVAKKNGYEDAYITVDVTTGITSLKVAMIPSNTNTLNVTVLDSISRSAIQGVAVTRDNATVCNNEQDNVTNALGACTGTNQNAGSVRLNASKVGYETTTATASIISRDSDVIILMRPTSILLSVYDSAGASLSGVTVSYGTNWSNSCTEAPTGTFTCPNLTTAATPLKISKDSNYVSQYISAYLGTGPLSIVLNRVASPGTLTVNVVDQNNNAVSGTTIKIDDVECTQVSNICTKTGLAAGQYLIQASKDGENGYMTISMTAEATTEVIIVVRALPTAATTSFSLYDSSDQPVPVATITPSSGSCATTETSGTYNCSGLLLIPTAFRIDAEGFDSIFVNTTPTIASNGSVKVILSRKVATVNTLNVTVVDATSPTTFLAGAIVNQCVSTSNSNGTTDANGMCTKSDIAVGPLPVEVSKTDYEPAYTTVTISSTGQTSLKVALRPTNAKIYFNIFDSRTGQPLEATVTGVSVDPYVCASGACSISPSAKGVLSISVANIAGGYLTANATVGYLGYPVVLNLYLTPISTLTVTFPEFSPSVTVTVSGSTTYTCTGLSASSTSCIISNLPYGYYTLTSNSGKAGSVSVYQPNSSVDLS